MNRILLAASLSLFPAAVAAQTCLGGASFADRRAQIGADASFGTGARSISGGVSVGSQHGPFVSVGFGTAHDDDIDDNATIFGATVGIGVPLPPGRTIALCPVASAVALNGVELEGGERLSVQSFAFGASVGSAVGVTPGFEIVPFAGAGVVIQTVTVRVPGIATTAESDHHYGVSLGAGLVIGKSVTIRPSAALAIADSGTARSYGLRVSFNFGRVARRAPPAEGAGSLAIVWMNKRSGVYYCKGSRWYGATPYGEFVTERDALAAGGTPEYGRRC